jgi:hypothetical protein
MPRIEKQELHDHNGGEIEPEVFYARLYEPDALNLQHVIIPTIAKGVLEAGGEVGIVAIGSATDLISNQYRDIDLLVCAKDPSVYSRMQRIKVSDAFRQSDVAEVVEMAHWSDLTVKDMWIRVIAGNTPSHTLYEIVLPDPDIHFTTSVPTTSCTIFPLAKLPDKIVT